MPSGCNVCNSRIQKLSLFLSLIIFPTWIVVNDIHFGSTKVIQWVPRWLTFSYVLRPADVTVKEVNHIGCFAIYIAKDLVLLSCRLAMEHLCVLQLETTLATLVTTWLTLADRRWRSRYRSSDQCILNGFRSPERYNGWFRE